MDLKCKILANTGADYRGRMCFPKIATTVCLVPHALLAHATLPARGEICLGAYLTHFQPTQCS